MATLQISSELTPAAELHRPAIYASNRRLPLSETKFDTQSNLRVYVASPEAANLQIRVVKNKSVSIVTAPLLLDDAIALRDWLSAYIERRGA